MTVRSPGQVDDHTPAAGAAHPLRRLGADEIRRARDALAGQGLVGEHTRFAYLGLEEPPKDEVLAFRPGDPVERRARAILLDTATGDARDVVVSITRGEVEASLALDPVRDGQPPIMLEDLAAVDEIVKADPGWRAAMARRGVTELDLARRARCRRGRSGSRATRGGGCCGCCPARTSLKPSTSASRRGPASPSTATRWPGRGGGYGSASTPARG